MSGRSDWTDKRALDEIRFCVNQAELKLEEARGIAETQWGAKDRRTEDIEGVWAEGYSLLNASWLTAVQSQATEGQPNSGSQGQESSASEKQSTVSSTDNSIIPDSE